MSANVSKVRAFRHRPAGLLILGGMVAVGLLGTPAEGVRVGEVTEFSSGIPPAAGLADLAPAPDGVVRFAQYSADRLGSIDRRGRVTQTPLPAGSGPRGVAYGPDGNMWVTFADHGSIARIGEDGRISQFRRGIPPNAQPQFIASGPDGNLWFTLSEVPAIGRITATGRINLFRDGLPTEAEFITPGPDGALWFTLPQSDAVGRITTRGAVTIHRRGIPVGSTPWDIVAAPDGRLWFTMVGTSRIGRISTSGRVESFPLSAPGLGIAVGADRNIWVTQPGTDSVTRVTGKGRATAFTTGISAGAEPHGISGGPLGSLWFGELAGDRIARITTGAAPPPHRPVVRDSHTGPERISATVRVPDGGWLSLSARSRGSSTPCVGARWVKHRGVSAVSCLRPDGDGRPRAAWRLRVTFTPFGGSPGVTTETISRGRG